MIRLAVACVVISTGLLVLGAILPVEHGPLGLLAILSPYLAYASVVLLPVVVGVWIREPARARPLALALALLVVVAGVRLGPEWVSLPAPVAAAASEAPGELSVATWNIEAGAAAAPAVVAMLTRHAVEVVVIEELTTTVAAAIEADPTLAERWPHRALFPSAGVAGIGLLSAHPISNVTSELHPVRLEATLDVAGRSIVVLGAHPFPAEIVRRGGVPLGLQPATRNAELAMLRARAAELEAAGSDVLLIGDFNTAPTEPAFARLTAGLHDAHASVGLGPGWTWRPATLSGLPIGLLRIDLVLSTADLVPNRITIDCAGAADHCLVEATLFLRA